MNWWLFTPEMPVLSIAVWVLVGLVLMYLARRPAERALLRCSQMIHAQMRLGARALQRMAELAAQRNQLALRELQQELVQRQLERELERLSTVVDRDLAGFQELQRKLNEQVTAVAEDYEHAAQVPPAAPEWVAAVDAIARLPGDTSAESLGKILNDIHATIQNQQREAMREYRWSVTARHKILAGMRPHWRKLASLLERVSAKTEGLQRRIRHIDRLMERFEALLAGGRVTLSAIGGRFMLSTGVLGLAVAVGLFNFQLLAGPLSVTLGAAYLGPIPMGDYAAAVHTVAVFGLGVILFESLQVTRMFPLVCGLSARARSVVAVLTLALLAAMAVMSSLLAVWWQAENPGLPLQVLALLGLVLPLLLSLTALPLENFSYTLPPVLAALSRLLLSIGAVVMRLLGALALQLGQLLVQIYDIVLVVPLGLERLWLERRRASAEAQTPAAGRAVPKPGRDATGAGDPASGSSSGPVRQPSAAAAEPNRPPADTEHALRAVAAVRGRRSERSAPGATSGEEKSDEKGDG